MAVVTSGRLEVKNPYGTVPRENFIPLKSTMLSGHSGWINANAVIVNGRQEAWLSEWPVYYSYDNFKNRYRNEEGALGLFVTFKDDHYEVYMPKENNQIKWHDSKATYKSLDPIKLISTEIPISAFDEMIKEGLAPDLAKAKKEYTTSTTLIAEKD